MSVRLSDLPLAPDNLILSSYIPVSDMPNDTSYKIPIQSLFDNFTPNRQNIIQTTSHTLTKSDYNCDILFDNINDSELVVPSHPYSRTSLGLTINIIRYNTGNVHIVPANGVTIHSETGFFLKTQYSVATLIKIQPNVWFLSGDLITDPSN